MVRRLRPPVNRSHAGALVKWFRRIARDAAARYGPGTSPAAGTTRGGRA